MTAWSDVPLFDDPYPTSTTWAPPAPHAAFGLVWEYDDEVIETGAPVVEGGQVRVAVSTRKDDTTVHRVTRLHGDAAYLGDGKVVPVSKLRSVVRAGRMGALSTRTAAGDPDPDHLLVAGENLHVMAAMEPGSAQFVYVDPPYNVGRRWTYDCIKIDRRHAYRHSRWLTFMHNRLVAARRLMDPAGSALALTIDEHERHRAALLLEQIFEGATIQHVTAITNPSGSWRARELARVDESVFLVTLGDMSAADIEAPTDGAVRWTPLNRDGQSWRRTDRQALFYPIYVDPTALVITGAGPTVPAGVDRTDAVVDPPAGSVAVWPFKQGAEATWQLSQETLAAKNGAGYVKVTQVLGERMIARYLTSGQEEAIARGDIEITGRDARGVVQVAQKRALVRPRTVWDNPAYDAKHGTREIARLVPGARFPFPKSVQYVADTLALYLADRPDAHVVDIFGGSATTAHAVAALNARDGGSRRSTTITLDENNLVTEVAWPRLTAALAELGGTARLDVATIEPR